MNQPTVTCRKERVGTWSESKMATRGASSCASAWLILVAGLGVGVIVARHVADAGFFGKDAELVALAIVQDVDVEPVGRPVDVHGGQRGVANDAERLVVRGDEEIDSRPLIGIVRQRHGGAAQRPESLQVTEVEDGEGVHLCEEQRQHEKDVEQSPMRGRIPEKVNHGRDAPPRIAQRGVARRHHERKRDEVGA